MRFWAPATSLLAVTALILCSISYGIAREKYLLKVDLDGLLKQLTSSVQIISKRQAPSIPIPTLPSIPVASLRSEIVSEATVITSAVKSEATAILGDLTSILNNAIQNVEEHLKLEVFHDRYNTPQGTERGSYEPFASLDTSALDNIPGSGSIESTLEAIKEVGNLVNPRNIQRVGYDLPLFSLITAVFLALSAIALLWVERPPVRLLIVTFSIVLCFSSCAVSLFAGSILLFISHNNPVAAEGISITTNSNLSGVAIAAGCVTLLLAFNLLLGEKYVRRGADIQSSPRSYSDDAEEIRQVCSQNGKFQGDMQTKE